MAFKSSPRQMLTLLRPRLQQALLRYTASAGAHDLAARAAGPEALVALQALQTLIGHDLRSAFPLTGGQGSCAISFSIASPASRSLLDPSYSAPGRKFYDISSGQNITLGGQVLRGIFQSVVRSSSRLRRCALYI